MITPKDPVDTTDFFQVLDSTAEAGMMAEKRLMIAIIQRALIDYTVPVKGKRHYQYDAAAWLFSRDRGLMSLWWVCDALSDRPSELQRRIQTAARNRTIRITGVIVRVDTK
jgi:hypothetical protein